MSTFYGKIGAYMVAQRCTLILGKGHAIARCWCLTAKKWRPVVFKILESCGDIDWLGYHFIEASILKQGGQRFRAADGKSSALVECSSVWVQGGSSIPKMTHHLHLTGVIPNIGPDDAVRARRSFHFAYCF